MEKRLKLMAIPGLLTAAVAPILIPADFAFPVAFLLLWALTGQYSDKLGRRGELTLAHANHGLASDVVVAAGQLTQGHAVSYVSAGPARGTLVRPSRSAHCPYAPSAKRATPVAATDPAEGRAYRVPRAGAARPQYGP